MIRAGGSRPRDRGFESHSNVYWMDVSQESYYIEKKKNRGSQMGHTKKNIYKKENCRIIVAL